MSEKVFRGHRETLSKRKLVKTSGTSNDKRYVVGNSIKSDKTGRWELIQGKITTGKKKGENE